ncbi:putative F-box/LRR-repeat protein At3g28410 [Lycium ferocissimum]|uniref:putative F-box/LRR-repeat protein At3g28410 n=1 Tax=Lycium ferocissimum TaxID=112874 RepID=UPI002814A6F0|nr:putative F-box/LRR-repeat protein At3g28410 [Lycium ferocissimum]
MASIVEDLRITFGLRENHANEINEWIHFAMFKNVKRLKLDFSSLLGYDCYSYYTFHELFLQLLCNISGFDSLISLSLNTVVVTDDTVTRILSNCPLLETLALKNTRSLWSLVVNGPPLKLKHLKIKHCFQLAVVEILAENLVSFKYLGSLIDISFGNVPLLSEVLIGGDYVKYWVNQLDQLSYDLSQLHTLTLNQNYMVSSSHAMLSLDNPSFFYGESLKAFLLFLAMFLGNVSC